MARIFTDGAESRDGLFWDSFGGSVAAGKSSPYCYWSGPNYKSFTPVTEAYWRMRVHWTSSEGWGWGGCNRFPRFRNGATELGYLYEDGNHYPGFILGSCNVLATEVLHIDTPYLFEVYIKVAATGGRVTVKQDGDIILDYTGNTGTTPIDGIWFGNFNYGGLFVDDLAMNDTAISVYQTDQGWCGDGIVVAVPVDGNGSHNNWMGSDADQVDNYALVDEIPSNSETDYVTELTENTGVQDQYAVSNAFDGTNRVIERVWIETRARKTAAAAALLKLGVLPSGGSDTMSAGLSVPMTYRRVVGDDLKENPANAQVWTAEDIAALEAIIEVG